MHSKIIQSKEEMYAIIDACEVCYVAMTDLEGKPYLLPFNFGRKDNVIYLHCGPEGKKLNILREKPAVCISFSNGYSLYNQHEKVACSYGMMFRSVLVYGNVEFLEDYQQKIDVLNIVMKQYVKKDFSYSEPAVNNVVVMKIEIKEMTGKKRGY